MRDRAKEFFDLLWCGWCVASNIGMMLWVFFTVTYWAWCLTNHRPLLPQAPAPRQVIETHERIPATNFPTTPESE